MKKIIIFTDLDGTLLDADTYSFAEASPTIQLLRERDIPLIICSSKTRAEIEHYRMLLENRHPFISENGGGIFIPKAYFSPTAVPPHLKIVSGSRYDTIQLGARYGDLCAVLHDLRQEGYPVKGFSDMTIEEVSGLTNLPLHEARMAKQRDFDEPFVLEGDVTDSERLSTAIQTRGFTVTRGRFFHILGNSNKGMAVEILTELYKKQLGEILTVGVGDSPNDIPMLKAVDIPVIVQKPDGRYDPAVDLPELMRADDIGPKGWNTAIAKLLSFFLPSE